MSYFEDMLTRSGFNDGHSLPDGAFEYRALYIQYLNAMAARFGCDQRAFAYDRGGSHNPCLIVFANADTVARLGLTDHDLANLTRAAEILPVNTWTTFMRLSSKTQRTHKPR